jgi:hypothetical protein
MEGKGQSQRKVVFTVERTYKFQARLLSNQNPRRRRVENYYVWLLKILNACE